MRLLVYLYLMDIAWAPSKIKENGKLMYLDYQTADLFSIRPIIKAYHKYKIDYCVKKNCLGIYKIYSEKRLWNLR